MRKPARVPRAAVAKSAGRGKSAVGRAAGVTSRAVKAGEAADVVDVVGAEAVSPGGD